MPHLDLKIGMFTDFANSRPGRQTSMVKSQYNMMTDPTRQPWNFYGPVVRAIRGAAADSDPAAVLNKAVQQADDRQARHFVEIREGFLKAWNIRDSLVRLHAAAVLQDGVQLRINPQLGVRKPDGSTEAVLLYVKEPPLTAAAAKVVVRLLHRQVDEILPGARPRVLDVRRARYFDLPAQRYWPNLDIQAAGLLGQYRAIWTAIA